MLIGTGERALDLQALTSAETVGHLPPWYWQGMAHPHPGLVQGEVPVEGDSLGLHLLWLRWSQPLPLPHCQGQPVGLIYSGIMFQALFCWWGCSPFSKGHPEILPGCTRWLHLPLNGAPAVGSHLGTFHSGFGFPTVGSCLGISFLTSQGPGPHALAAARVSTAAGSSAAGGVAHSLHPFFKGCDCLQGPLVGIPHEGHHFLIQVSFHCSKPLVHSAVHSSKLHMGDQAKGHWLATASILPPAVQMTA